MHKPARAALRRQPVLGEKHMESWYLPMRIDHNYTVARAILGSCFFHQTTWLFFLSVSRLKSMGCTQPVMLILFWHLRACQLCVPLRPYRPWHTSLFRNRRANSALGCTTGFWWESSQGLIWPQCWCSNVAALCYLVWKCMQEANELWAKAMQFCWEAGIATSNFPQLLYLCMSRTSV